MKKELITPKKAMEYLKRNVANRPLSQSRVRQYASAMKENKWEMNGDCIRFNSNGDLIDGQHRLTACATSGVSFETYILHGLSHAAFDTIDQGAKRTVSDVFARQGHKHYTLLAAAIRWVWWYSSGMKVVMRADQANELLAKNPGIERCVDIAAKMAREAGKLAPPALIAFLIYECGKGEQDRSERFWTSVTTGGSLNRGSPAHKLHQRLVQNLSSVAKLNKETIAALCIKAWNAHVTGKSISCLKWSMDEEFPRITH